MTVLRKRSPSTVRSPARRTKEPSDCETERVRRNMVQHGTTHVSGEAFLNNNMVIGPPLYQNCGDQAGKKSKKPNSAFPSSCEHERSFCGAQVANRPIQMGSHII